jgi:transposase
MEVSMLGRRSSQLGLFDAQTLPHRVPADSFYGRMITVFDVLFRDEDLGTMYHSGTGRPSLPPSLMCGVLLLQFHDNVSDEEAVQRLRFDLRWKVALHLPLDYPGFDPSSLSVFRTRLVEHGKERYAFDRFIQVGREAGFIADKVTLLTDTTSVKGAGAVQNTYTLLRKGMRKLLKAMGYHLPGKRQGLGEQAQRLVASYLDQDKKAEIDWSDAAQRERQLNVLVADAEATLELALEQSDEPEVQLVGWLLTKILGDDVQEDTDGVAHIGQGTARDRIVSLTDPEMRHGRKSAAHRFDGFKASVSIDQESELILDIDDLAANAGDGQALMPTIDRVEMHTDIEIERVIGDGAYVTGDNLAACVDHCDAQGQSQPIDLVGPLRQPVNPTVDKTAFEIDLGRQTCTCPCGYTVQGRTTKDKQRRAVLKFTFDHSNCEACALFADCVRSKTNGRTVTTHVHEALLQQARARQQTEGFKALYNPRSAVERIISELVRHGLRQTRYIGGRKRRLQRLWTAAAVNLKRLFTLIQANNVDLHAAIAALT